METNICTNIIFRTVLNWKLHKKPLPAKRFITQLLSLGEMMMQHLTTLEHAFEAQSENLLWNFQEKKRKNNIFYGIIFSFSLLCLLHTRSLRKKKKKKSFFFTEIYLASIAFWLLVFSAIVVQISIKFAFNLQ